MITFCLVFIYYKAHPAGEGAVEVCVIDGSRKTGIVTDRGPRLLPGFGLHAVLVKGEGQAGTATLREHAVRISRLDDGAGIVEQELRPSLS